MRYCDLFRSLFPLSALAIFFYKENELRQMLRSGLGNSLPFNFISVNEKMVEKVFLNHSISIFSEKLIQPYGI